MPPPSLRPGRGRIRRSYNGSPHFAFAPAMPDPRNRTASGARPRAIPLRPLGTTGVSVSALGLGGYHLGKIASQRDAIGLVHEAIDAGVTFLDNAWEYHDGRSEELMGKALAG